MYTNIFSLFFSFFIFAKAYFWLLVSPVHAVKFGWQKMIHEMRFPSAPLASSGNQTAPYMSASGSEKIKKPVPKNFSKVSDFQSCDPTDVDFVGAERWNGEKEKLILCPYDYIAREPGKEFRTLVLNTFNSWLNVPETSLNIISEVVRMLHTASLLIDDIQDNSVLRRGKPVAHSVYGVAQTINAANYVYFQALQALNNLRDPANAIKIYTNEMVQLHRGQGMDLYWRDNLTCPTEGQYLEMASNKTGGLFRLAVKLMQSESPTSIDCMPLVNLIGWKKGVAEDLTEGKFSFPVIHSINSDLDNNEVLDILAQKPTDVKVKRRAVEYINSTGSLEYTRRVVGRLVDEAVRVAREIDRGQGKAQEIEALLQKLCIS